MGGWVGGLSEKFGGYGNLEAGIGRGRTGWVVVVEGCGWVGVMCGCGWGWGGGWGYNRHTTGWGQLQPALACGHQRAWLCLRSQTAHCARTLGAPAAWPACRAARCRLAVSRARGPCSHAALQGGGGAGGPVGSAATTCAGAAAQEAVVEGGGQAAADCMVGVSAAWHDVAAIDQWVAACPGAALAALSSHSGRPPPLEAPWAPSAPCCTHAPRTQVDGGQGQPPSAVEVDSRPPRRPQALHPEAPVRRLRPALSRGRRQQAGRRVQGRRPRLVVRTALARSVAAAQDRPCAACCCRACGACTAWWQRQPPCLASRMCLGRRLQAGPAAALSVRTAVHESGPPSMRLPPSARPALRAG